MASCLDTIVTLGVCPDDGQSSSGFTLLNAPGMSIKNFAATTTDNNVSGVGMALDIKKRTITQVRNDFIAALQMNRVIPAISNPVYETALFDPNVSVGMYEGYRGSTLYKNHSYRGTLRKTYLETVKLFPLGNGDTTLQIFDGVSTYTYPISVVANQVNVFDAESLGGFPFEMQRDILRVTVDQTNIPFAKAAIACAKGCGGTMPNPCGWSEGWMGSAPIKSEGFGVSLSFKCECDYSRILCDLSKSFIGELIWLKWQIGVFEEQYKSNRFTNWVTYNQERIVKEILPDLNNRYVEKWNSLMAGMFSILQSYRDQCLDCRGISWKTNV